MLLGGHVQRALLALQLLWHDLDLKASFIKHRQTKRNQVSMLCGEAYCNSVTFYLMDLMDHWDE